MVYAYITNYGDNDIDNGTVSVVDLNSETVVATITVEIGPYGVAVSPDGSKVYVTNNLSNTLSVIATSTNTVSSTPDLTNGRPRGVAFTPDGSRAFVACYNNRELITFDTSDDSAIYTLTFAAGATPYGVAVLPDGSYVYVADPGDDKVYVITAAGSPPAITTTISVSDGPLSVAATPDSAYVYVGRGNGTVAMIDTSTDTASTITITGAAGGIYGIAVSPDGTTVYVTDDSDGEVYYFAAGEASPTVNNITTISDTSITGIGFAPDSTVYVANTSADTISYFAMGATSPTVNSISVGTNPAAFGLFISSQAPLPFPAMTISDWFGC